MTYVDPVALAFAALQSSALVASEFGGAEHVSARNEPPYPHLRVVPSPLPSGGGGRMLWVTDAEVLLEAYGYPDGRPGPAELRRLLYTALGVLGALPAREYGLNEPVVVDVLMRASAAWIPDVATGQPRWAATVQVSAHPSS